MLLSICNKPKPHNQTMKSVCETLYFIIYNFKLYISLQVIAEANKRGRNATGYRFYSNCLPICQQLPQPKYFRFIFVAMKCVQYIQGWSKSVKQPSTGPSIGKPSSSDSFDKYQTGQAVSSLNFSNTANLCGKYWNIFQTAISSSLRCPSICYSLTRCLI